MITLGLEDWRPVSPERRSITLADFPVLGSSYLDPPSSAGVVVNQDSALTVSAYWNGCAMIAQSIGVLDRFLYRRVGEDDRERATTHPVYKVVHSEPNTNGPAQTFWETLAFHAVSWGNGYAEIERDAARRPIALWTIPPDQICPRIDVKRGASSTLWYEYRGQSRIEAENIIHVPGLGYDGIRGYSPVYLARRSLGLAIAAEEFGSSLFGNGAWNGAVYEFPGKLKDQAVYDRLRASLEADRGPTRAHRVKILEEGMKLSRPIVIPPNDAQFLETRQLQVEEVARWLNLPSWKLKIQQDARPGGNPEISQIDYLTDTLLPWTTRIEQELNRKLIPKDQRSTFYVEHLYEKLLRTDVTTRMATYKSLFDMGVVDADWIAKTENLPKPKPKEPAPAAAPPQPPADGEPAPEPQPAAPEADSMRAIADAQRALLMDAASRYMRVEAERSIRGARKGAATFEKWLAGRHDEDLSTLSGAILPVLRMIAAHRGGGDAEGLAAKLALEHVEDTRDLLLALPAKDLAAGVERLVGNWENVRSYRLVENAWLAMYAWGVA